MDIKFTEIPKDELKTKPASSDDLGFGKEFTDYMFTMEYETGKGWFNPEIRKFANFSLAPSALVFHYAQEIFEGMKSYRRPDGEFGLFRPEMNYARFNRSANRMSMPEFPVDIHERALKELLRIERDWYPPTKAGTIYVRPTMIATEEILGVKESSKYIFFIILSPSGYYFKSGFHPVKVMVADEYVRAAVGGTGTAKAGGNYAASLLAGKIAREAGCNQVLWLDANERKYIEEVGAMNMLFVFDNKTIVTPSLTGTILEGVTRDSVIKLSKHLGYEVEERRISIDEIIDGIKSGRVTESFGCGTAAVITPVGELLYKGENYKITEDVGPISKRLYDEVTGIQWGINEDVFGWTQTI